MSIIIEGNSGYQSKERKYLVFMVSLPKIFYFSCIFCHKIGSYVILFEAGIFLKKFITGWWRRGGGVKKEGLNSVKNLRGETMIASKGEGISLFM